MSKLEIAKDIIHKNLNEGDCGIFNTVNLAGDTMTTIYNEDGLTIDICYEWRYFEVFGLNDEEFEKLKEYYNGLTIIKDLLDFFKKI